MVGANVKADLVDAARHPGRRIVRPQAATAHVLVGLQQEDGPILQAVGLLAGYLGRQALLDLGAGQLAPGIDEARDADVAP